MGVRIRVRIMVRIRVRAKIMNRVWKVTLDLILTPTLIINLHILMCCNIAESLFFGVEREREEEKEERIFLGKGRIFPRGCEIFFASYHFD
jgi:hypothetical protein